MFKVTLYSKLLHGARGTVYTKLRVSIVHEVLRKKETKKKSGRTVLFKGGVSDDTALTLQARATATGNAERCSAYVLALERLREKGLAVKLA